MKVIKIINLVILTVLITASLSSLSNNSNKENNKSATTNGEIDIHSSNHISYNDIPDRVPSEVIQMEDKLSNIYNKADNQLYTKFKFKELPLGQNPENV